MNVFLAAGVGTINEFLIADVGKVNAILLAEFLVVIKLCFLVLNVENICLLLICELYHPDICHKQHQASLCHVL